MAHKHNRRRLRPRSRNSYLVGRTDPDHLRFLLSGITAEAEPLNQGSQRSLPLSAILYIKGGRYCPKAIREMNPVPNIISQDRYRTLLEEAQLLEADQIKIFGGEPGDDVGLCYRMLEVFNGLDFIDF